MAGGDRQHDQLRVFTEEAIDEVPVDAEQGEVAVVEIVVLVIDRGVGVDLEGNKGYVEFDKQGTVGGGGETSLSLL